METILDCSIIFSYITLHYFVKARGFYKQISKITPVMSVLLIVKRTIIKLSGEMCTGVGKRLSAFSLNSLRVTDSVRTHVGIVLEGYSGFGSHVGNSTSDPSSSSSLSPPLQLEEVIQPHLERALKYLF